MSDKTLIEELDKLLKFGPVPQTQKDWVQLTTGIFSRCLIALEAKQEAAVPEGYTLVETEILENETIKSLIEIQRADKKIRERIGATNDKQD